MLEDKKILITGATGSLGLETCRSFSKKGYKILATGRKTSMAREFESLGIDFKHGDLTDSAFVDSLFHDIDYVIHCAALTSPFGHWEKFFLANVLSTKNMVEAAKKFRVKRFIHISTPSIYFNGLPRLNVHEDEPIPPPLTNYAKSKLMGEDLVDELRSSGIETITLRPRAIFGPNDHVILPRILRLMKKGRFPLFNGGKALIDLTYSENVIDAIELSLHAPEEALYLKYNITNGESRSLLSICEELQKGLQTNVRYINLPLSPVMLAAKIIENVYMLFHIDKEPALSQYSIGLMSFDHTLSIELARKNLNYNPRITISEGLKKTLEIWKK